VMLTFWPTSAFNKVDLPTFGRPTIAISPQRVESAVAWAPTGMSGTRGDG